jgi:hypothetical protein
LFNLFLLLLLLLLPPKLAMVELFKDQWLPYSKLSIESFGFTITPKEPRD